MLKIVFLITILYWIFLKPQSDKSVNRYITICLFLCFAIIAFRSDVIYGDTYGYVYQFKHLCQMSLTQVLEMWDKDKFFWIVSYYLSVIFHGNYTLWFILISLLVMIPLGKLIRKYSIEPMYSFVLFVYLGLLFFFMAGIRQTVAISFILMGALVLLDSSRTIKNRVIYYTLYVFLAYLFHGAAFVAILALFFINRPLNRTTLFTYGLILVLCFVAGRYMLSNVIGYIGQFDERYMGYGQNMRGATYTYFLQQFILILPSVIFLKKRLHEQPITLLFHFSVIGLLFVSLSPVIAEMFRLSYFFSWANILLFTYTISEMRKCNKFYPIIFLAMFVLFVMLVFNSNEYYFFFEDVTHITTQFDTSEYLI